MFLHWFGGSGIEAGYLKPCFYTVLEALELKPGTKIIWFGRSGGQELDEGKRKRTKSFKAQKCFPDRKTFKTKTRFPDRFAFKTKMRFRQVWRAIIG